jgi:hypothetical protein
MKVYLTITALLVSSLLLAQGGESGASHTAYEEGPTQRRKAKIHNLQFDRIDYFFKDNLLQYAIQHNGGNGFSRTWRYFYQKEGTDDIINRLKAKYPNKQFHGATQVVFRNKVNYEVIMEDKRRWYVYQTDSLGTISLKKKFRKH